MEIVNNPNFEIIRHDITFPLFLEVDEIYNLACPAAPIHYQKDPVQTIKTCVHGAINMLGLAKRTRARILQASTSEIYGDPEVHPQKENYKGAVSISGPRACYDEGKGVQKQYSGTIKGNTMLISELFVFLIPMDLECKSMMEELSQIL